MNEIKYCTNCGKRGHLCKNCYQPIISYGIIGFKVINSELKKILSNYSKEKSVNKENINICKYIYSQKCNKQFQDINDSQIYQTYNEFINNNISCLLIRRKQSFNYGYLVRGLYSTDIETILSAINKLTKEEYNNLITKDFNELWIDICGKYAKMDDDYEQSKQKFTYLSKYILPYVKHRININYDNPEWGFPKGRRLHKEYDIECAKREFEEETGLKKHDYIILDKIEPIIERIFGTDGKRYKYIYYIALLDTDNALLLNQNDSQKFEIGDIGLFNIDNGKKLLREYNIERIKIIDRLKLFLTYNIIEYKKNESN